MNEYRNEINSTESEARPKIERITAADVKPEIPVDDGTILVLQRHAKDNRDPRADLELGELFPQSAEQIRINSEKFFEEMFEQMDPEERKKIDVLLVASDTKLGTPLGITDPSIKNEHQRAMDTAQIVMDSLKKVLTKYSLPETQILNKTGNPAELTSKRLGEPNILEQSPDFVKHMQEKYGIGIKFWIAFENDDEKSIREQMNAEGPDEIAQRVKNYVKVVENSMSSYHRLNPGRKVLVWAVTHYDTISPFVKRYISKVDKTEALPVDNGGGIVLNLSDKEKPTATVGGHKYDFSLE